jgi:hypothetical protein
VKTEEKVNLIITVILYKLRPEILTAGGSASDSGIYERS